MCIHKEYAETLRVGEELRDASDNIKGFLFQDLLAIDLIIKCSDDDRIYVEWIEDIFMENPTAVSIYQVKHYPKSQLNFQDIYENMFYQFLKFNLYESEEKEVKTYCFYHAEDIKTFEKVLTQGKIKENDLKTVNKLDIQQKLVNCNNMPERKELLFEEIASKSLLDELHFEAIRKDNIEITKQNLKNTLYDLFETSIKADNEFQMLNDDSIRDILLALAVQYVQNSYYKKRRDFSKRCMSKELLLNHINRICEADEQKNTEIIKYLVLGYIDEIFNEVLIDIENEKNADKYKEIYLSTKECLSVILKDKRTRFKFLNGLSTDEHKVLNWDKYLNADFEEKNKFLEHKSNIKLVIRMAWKILYSVDCNNFGRYIKESDDCFFFEIENEEARQVIILSSTPGQSVNDMKKILPRVTKMKTRPNKWYMYGDLCKFYMYSYNVNKVRDVELGDYDSVYYKENNSFKMECMRCLKFDAEKMEDKDPDLKECLFKLNCVNGG